jgi:hypothetical protein
MLHQNRSFGMVEESMITADVRLKSDKGRFGPNNRGSVPYNALRLLAKISKDRKGIYPVCHSVLHRKQK